MSAASNRAVRVESDAIGGFLTSLAQPGQPGLAIGIAHNGKVLFEGTAGLADIESRRPLTPAIGMAIGSTTKHMASLAFLLLCERGRATVDDTVGRYLPHMPSHVRAITIAQLMGHLSGLRDVAELSMLFDGFEQQIELGVILQGYGDVASVDAPPGTRWSYNNGGYLLLSTVLERAWDAPLETVLKDRIFSPAGLESTWLQRFDADASVIRAKHYHASDATFVRTRRSIEGLGQGGITASPRDLLRWLGQFAAPMVGDARSWRYLTTPMRLSNGTPSGYGAGIRLGRYRGLRIMHHPGAVPGGNAQMLRVPDLDLDIVVLANRQDLSAIEIANQLLGMCVPGLAPPLMPTKQVRPLGVFRAAQSGRTVHMCDDHVVLDGMRLPVATDAAGGLRPIAAGMLRPERIRHDVKVDRLIVSHLGTRERLSRLAADGDELPNRIAWRKGPYSLTVADGSLHLKGPVDGAAYDFVPIGAGLWEAHARGPMPMTAILAILPDGSAMLSNPRVRGLRLAMAERPA